MKLTKLKRGCGVFFVAVILCCIGCTVQEGDVEKPIEEGYIYRNEITLGDFAFLFEEWNYESGKTDQQIGVELYDALKSDIIKPDDIFKELGLPQSTIDENGIMNYDYLIGDELDCITIKYIQSKDEIDLDFKLESIKSASEQENLIMLWVSGGRETDAQQYKMDKRFDISESELSYIDSNVTSKEIQQRLGAPHFTIGLRDAYIESAPGDIMVYSLASGNYLNLIYFRQGYILRCWIEDKEGEQLKLFIDRDISSFYE